MYQKITPFPDKSDFDFPELHALESVWQEKKGELENNGAFNDFIKKMKREWAIETGIIERLYGWDRGVTEMLIEQGIEATIISHNAGIPRDEAEHIQAVITDHLDIVEELFGYIKGEHQLTEHFIRGLQAQFTAHQQTTDAIDQFGNIVKVTLKKGEYKTHPNNPRRPDGEMHTYCPPAITQEEMARLVSIYRDNETLYPPEIKAAWLHHRFTQIHPFQDGNGRVARALASLVFLKDGLFPLVVRESDRHEYITALEEADAGNLLPLTSLFVKRQRDAILKAIGLEQQVQQSKYANQIIDSALLVLKNKYSQRKAEVDKVYQYADRLFALAENEIGEISSRLDNDLWNLWKTTPSGKDRFYSRSNSADSQSEQRHYFQKQIISVANQFDYYANFENYRSWVRLLINTTEIFDFVVSFHGYGTSGTGLLAASAFTYIRAPKEEGGTEPVNLRRASTDLFQFNYIESYESTEKRFSEWLDSSIAIALAEWKKSLY